MKEVITLNKNEFLDILRDYLKRDFSENELNDILRDYEEYFVNGEIEGKSDLEIIASLGSPKSIAIDLISQIKDKNESQINKKDKIEEVFIKSKTKVKEVFEKCKNYIDEKLTPTLDRGVSLSSRGTRIILFLLSLALVVLAFSAVFFMVCVAGLLVISLIAFFISVPIMISFSWAAPQIALFFIFLSIAFLGFQILAWQIFIFITKYMKKIYNRYINWVKTRKIYINAGKIKERMNQVRSKGGGDNE